MGANPTLLMWPAPEPGKDTVDLSKVLLKALEGADVYITLTRSTDPQRHPRWIELSRVQKKFRGVNLPRRTLRNIISPALVDVDALEENQRVLDKLHPIIYSGKTGHVTSKLGMDVTFDYDSSKLKMSKEPPKAWDSKHEQGRGTSLPSGQLTIRGPREASVEGVIVADGAITYFNEVPSQPIRLTVKKGKVVSIEGGAEARKLQEIVKANKNADQVGEFAIGTNPRSRLNLGEIGEEKKALGQVHFALGYNIDGGGKTDSPVHIDMMSYNPTVEIDGKKIIKDGKVVL